MKLRYICDYCEAVFSAEDSVQLAPESDTAFLTGTAESDIIEFDEKDTAAYIPFTCDECSSVLGINEAGDLKFLSRPVIN